MQIIPIRAVPAQQLQSVLGGQNCQIAIYQKPQGLFVDLSSNGVIISVGVIAQDCNTLNPIAYSGFQGTLLFNDTQGNSDPVYTGLGSRYQLLYLTAAEYAQLLAAL